MSNKNYYYELDILRGLACLIVFFSHCPIYNLMGSDALFFSVGCNGVYIFFVISGFIISKTFGNQLQKIDNYNIEAWIKGVQDNLPYIYSFWRKRFLRLFPALFLLFFVLIIITLKQGIEMNQLAEYSIKLFRLIANFFILDHGMTKDLSDPINQFIYFKVGVIWSLDCEILFYIIFPLVIIFKNFFRILPIIFIIIFFIKSILYTFVDFKYLYYGIIANFDFFILGILIGKYHHKLVFKRNIGIFFTIICLYTLTIASPDVEIYRAYLNGLITSGWLVYIASAQKNILTLPILGKFLHFVGKRSYFIYLMHVIIKYVLQTTLDLISHDTFLKIIIIENSKISEHISNLLLLFFVLILSDLFYRFVEKPYIKM